VAFDRPLFYSGLFFIFFSKKDPRLKNSCNEETPQSDHEDHDTCEPSSELKKRHHIVRIFRCRVIYYKKKDERSKKKDKTK